VLKFLDEGTQLCDGVCRREFLRVGGIGLGGLSLPALLQSRATAAIESHGSFGKAKSVILFGLVGGPPQHETWDPKPDAPAEVRGEYGTIATKTSGLSVGELMPKTAALTDKVAVLRAVVTNDNAHSSSGYQMLTGIPHQPRNRESALPKPPNDSPCMGAMLRALKSDVGRLPTAVTIPEHIWNDGNFPWPGQDAGFLGKQFDPWLIHCQPHEDKFDVPGMTLPAEIAHIRLDRRRTLLQQVERKLGHLERDRAVERYAAHVRKAYELLSGSGAKSAFDLRQESDITRDRYGRSRFNQSVLLARRLVEAGVGLIQVNWTRVKGYENQGGWDTHAKHNESLKKLLMPRMDQCFTALLTDLDERGLLDETLVVWLGEFGRTPKFNRRAGRDHWGSVFSLALAGGGVRGGVVHGSSDKNAAFPADGVVEPKDIVATVFHCLGFAPETEIRDNLNRPIPISRGRVIHEIL